MTDFYSQNRCVCSTRSHGPLLCAFCLSFHFNVKRNWAQSIARTTKIRAQFSAQTKRDLGTILWAIDENMGTNLQAFYSLSSV